MVTCMLLGEPQILKLNPLNSTVADPTTCSRERGLSGALTPDPTSLSWDKDEGRQGVRARVRQRGEGGGIDCPRILGKLKNMRGYYHPAQQPDGEQMTFVLPNICRPREEEEIQVERSKSSGKERGGRRKKETGLTESFSFTRQSFLSVDHNMFIKAICAPQYGLP